MVSNLLPFFLMYFLIWSILLCVTDLLAVVFPQIGVSILNCLMAAVGLVSIHQKRHSASIMYLYNSVISFLSKYNNHPYNETKNYHFEYLLFVRHSNMYFRYITSLAFSSVNILHEE